MAGSGLVDENLRSALAVGLETPGDDRTTGAVLTMRLPRRPQAARRIEGHCRRALVRLGPEAQACLLAHRVAPGRETLSVDAVVPRALPPARPDGDDVPLPVDRQGGLGLGAGRERARPPLVAVKPRLPEHHRVGIGRGRDNQTEQSDHTDHRAGHGDPPFLRPMTWRPVSGV